MNGFASDPPPFETPRHHSQFRGNGEDMEKRRELEKAAWERKKFRAAADVAGLQIVLRSIRSRRHPEPDILCTLRNGERVAFELVELVDPDIARIESTLSSEGVWYGDPTLRNLRKHLVE